MLWQLKSASINSIARSLVTTATPAIFSSMTNKPLDHFSKTAPVLVVSARCWACLLEKVQVSRGCVVTKMTSRERWGCAFFHPTSVVLKLFFGYDDADFSVSHKSQFSCYLVQEDDFWMCPLGSPCLLLCRYYNPTVWTGGHYILLCFLSCWI